MNLQLTYPFKPFVVTQNWGNPNPKYAEQFNDPNFKLHNGIDAKPNYYQKTWPVYCPTDGFKVLQVDYAPQGGGHEVWLISKEKYQMFDKECYALMVFCHADTVLVKAGDEPVIGQLLIIGDNTGFSTGAHTHMGLYRVDYNGTWYTKLDTNDATGSFDPNLFFTEEYAIDKATLPTLIKNNLLYYQWVVGLK